MAGPGDRLPSEQVITLAGMRIVGRGKGLYSFVRLPRPNLIHVPRDLATSIATPIRLRDQTPALVRRVLGSDEQATLTQVFYGEVIRHFAGLANAWRVQGHERTTVSAGQIEVDEVYVGVDNRDNPCVLPISAKGGNDHLSYTQALSINLYALEKTKGKKVKERRYDAFEPRPLGLCRAFDDVIYLVEFSRGNDIRDIRIIRNASYALA